MNRVKRLDVIQVAEPCHQAWQQMRGDDQARFCAACQKHVYNLSAIPQDEAERLLCESAGSLCVRYEVGRDGRPVTLGYEKRGRGARGGWKFWTAIAAAGACMAGAVQAMVHVNKPPPVVMGAVPVNFAPASPPPPPLPSASSPQE